ncbi:hypothetical protein CNEO4_60035 [Clostridium neonatale]|nr:hypothetical protein CNEO4_60035 [Clostridium neonatale]
MFFLNLNNNYEIYAIIQFYFNLIRIMYICYKNNTIISLMCLYIPKDITYLFY